jgi:hypothetical protein
MVKKFLLLVGIALLHGSTHSHAQCNYGTGAVTGNNAPFETGSPAVTVAGNQVTVVSSTTIQGGIYNFINFTINAGATLTVVSGAGPLIIRCTGTATINGSILANGGNGTNGSLATILAPPGFGGVGGTGGGGWGRPGGNGGTTGSAGTVPGFRGGSFGSSSGGGFGGTGTTSSGPFAGAGGGGAGYGTAGTIGQLTTAGAGGAGGSAYGDALLTTSMTQSAITTTLLGGSGGGGGGARGAITLEGGGGGGGGGGAIQLAANTLIFGAAGLISVKGGVGGQSTNDGGGAYGGSGGGGSGGTIHLQYTTISGFTAGTNSNILGGNGGAVTPGGTSGGAGGNGAIGRLYSELCGTPTEEITTEPISGSPFCAGGLVSIPYTLDGTFNAGNTFTAQLSDATGSFAAPVNIGSLTTTVEGSISGTIPTNQLAGTGYRIRVISSNPSVVGEENDSDLTITVVPGPPAIEHIR